MRIFLAGISVSRARQSVVGTATTGKQTRRFELCHPQTVKRSRAGKAVGTQITLRTIHASPSSPGRVSISDNITAELAGGGDLSLDNIKQVLARAFARRNPISYRILGQWPMPGERTAPWTRKAAADG